MEVEAGGRMYQLWSKQFGSQTLLAGDCILWFTKGRLFFKLQEPRSKDSHAVIFLCETKAAGQRGAAQRAGTMGTQSITSGQCATRWLASGFHSQAIAFNIWVWWFNPCSLSGALSTTDHSYLGIIPYLSPLLPLPNINSVSLPTRSVHWKFS